MTFELLSKPSCMQCEATHIIFEDNGVVFKERDMSVDAEALALAKSFGFMQAPVVLVRNESGDIVDKWSGFHPERIAQYS